MTRKGWVLFIAMSVFWGIPYFFIKIAVLELDPVVVVFARLGIAACILVPVAAQSKKLGMVRKHWLAITGLALVQIVLPFLFISYGELHIATSLTSLLIASEPLLIALLALRLDPGERVGGLRLIGLFVGLLGVATLLGLDVGGDRQKLLGTGLVLLATAGYALGALLIKRPAIAALPTLGVVATECAISSILLLPLAATRLPTSMPSLQVIASLFVLGVVCTALAYLTFFALVAEVGASRGSVFTYINPVISVLLGVMVLREHIDAATILGFVLIIIGSWLSTR